MFTLKEPEFTARYYPGKVPIFCQHPWRDRKSRLKCILYSAPGYVIYRLLPTKHELYMSGRGTINTNCEENYMTARVNTDNPVKCQLQLPTKHELYMSGRGTINTNCEENYMTARDPKEAGSDDEEANLDEDEINKRFVLYS
ncbi:hypothetical protein DPMN_170195 [Dreissena polymorpha]|uniref:Uncharacterized protein n=1 Tax=Dreissena polymorpha TaxID=45954 RepID=A0A9D4DZ19_DREPO|nr:hypothetical protein DPMN_170195 [Dreissena polymorpha]